MIVNHCNNYIRSCFCFIHNKNTSLSRILYTN
nr:MAG TPA: hypothetical protein [Caudoviricetes sp.]